MNKEESKTIPIRKATHKELTEVIAGLHTQNYLKEMEIVRLNKEREIDIKYNKYLQKELAKANSIIKEVREKLLCYGETFDLKVHQEMQKELLEILDKVESDKE